MAIRIRMSADVLGRSRFGISPAQEVVGAVRLRSRHPAKHVRGWYARARTRMDPDLLSVLEALIPDDHDYVPDFLTPPPHRAADTIGEATRRIAYTSPEIVEHHLDIGLRGRRVRPEVMAQFGSEAAYERWRRAAPARLDTLLSTGPEALAVAAAEAVGAFFETAIEPDWAATRSVLEDDVRRRSDQLAARGAVAMLDGLGTGMSWNGAGVTLERRYEGVVDWADDGLLLVPSTAHVGPVQFAAEKPLTPMVVYRADGVARLWEPPVPSEPASRLGELIGDTRAVLLGALRESRSTADLARRTRWSEPTVSYHLQVLLRAGLVERSRRGRTVMYRLTARGAALLDA